MVAAGEALGHRKLIGFDMGGTSTDVAHYAGELELAAENMVAGVRVAAPMMQIHTVAAGGGSICSFDGARFRVGPHSAGANPGPACYRKGGPLTVTDCNLVLGRIDPAFFPHVFGPDGDQPLDRDAARARLEEIAEQMPEPKSLGEIAEGFLAIAVDNMANAIRKISVARGHDVTEYALACFGGAGGLVAGPVAAALDIPRVLIPMHPGNTCAMGLLMTDMQEDASVAFLAPADGIDLDALNARFSDMQNTVSDTLASQGVEPSEVAFTFGADIRYQGQIHELTVPFETYPVTGEELQGVFEAFEKMYVDIYTISLEDHTPEMTSLRVTGVGSIPQYELAAFGGGGEPKLLSVWTTLADGEHHRCLVRGISRYFTFLYKKLNLAIVQ